MPRRPNTPRAIANRDASGGVMLTVRDPAVLRRERQATGLSRPGLANATDGAVSESHIEKLELGIRTRVSLVVAQAIVSAIKDASGEDLRLADLFIKPRNSRPWPRVPRS